jgi:TetR/AcrR family transcriptional repressor of nem operon
MVQKLKSGRPLSFDRDQALEAAMRLFWEKGYDSVGLAELEARTGLNRSSLYNSFGDKQALFSAALARYLDAMGGPMLGALVDGAGGLDDVRAFLSRLAIHLDAHRGRGCFMVNTMADAGETNAPIDALADQYVDQYLAAVRAALARAAVSGEISKAEIEPLAHRLLAAVLAANLLARARQPRSRIQAVLEAALTPLA